MTPASVDPAQARPSQAEVSEPADDQMYRTLAISFLIGIALLLLFFIGMLVLLAGAS